MRRITRYFQVLKKYKKQFIDISIKAFYETNFDGIYHLSIDFILDLKTSFDFYSLLNIILNYLSFVTSYQNNHLFMSAAICIWEFEIEMS